MNQPNPINCDLEPLGGRWWRCRRCGERYKFRGPPPYNVNCPAVSDLVRQAAKANAADAKCGGCEGKSPEERASIIEAEVAEHDAKAESKPGFLSMMGHFAKDLRDFAQDGFQLVSRQNYDCRVATCADCPLRVKRRCSACGCLVAVRARGAVWHCPDPEGDRWKACDDAAKAPAG